MSRIRASIPLGNTSHDLRPAKISVYINVYLRLCTIMLSCFRHQWGELYVILCIWTTNCVIPGLFAKTNTQNEVDTFGAVCNIPDG